MFGEVPNSEPTPSPNNGQYDKFGVRQIVLRSGNLVAQLMLNPCRRASQQQRASNRQDQLDSARKPLTISVEHPQTLQAKIKTAAHNLTKYSDLRTSYVSHTASWHSFFFFSESKLESKKFNRTSKLQTVKIPNIIQT